MLAMCIKLPTEGEAFLAKLTDAHFSQPVAARARDWLRNHLDDPMAELSRADDELYSYVADLKLRADEEPASVEAMDLSSLRLERSRVDDEIAAAGTNAGPPRSSSSVTAPTSPSASREPSPEPASGQRAGTAQLLE